MSRAQYRVSAFGTTGHRGRSILTQTDPIPRHAIQISNGPPTGKDMVLGLHILLRQAVHPDLPAIENLHCTAHVMKHA